MADKRMVKRIFEARSIGKIIRRRLKKHGLRM